MGSVRALKLLASEGSRVPRIDIPHAWSKRYLANLEDTSTVLRRRKAEAYPSRSIVHTTKSDCSSDPYRRFEAEAVLSHLERACKSITLSTYVDIEAPSSCCYFIFGELGQRLQCTRPRPSWLHLQTPFSSSKLCAISWYVTCQSSAWSRPALFKMQQIGYRSSSLAL